MSNYFSVDSSKFPDFPLSVQAMLQSTNGDVESQDPLEGFMYGRPVTESGSNQAMDTTGKYNKQYIFQFNFA